MSSSSRDLSSPFPAQTPPPSPPAKSLKRRRQQAPPPPPEPDHAANARSHRAARQDDNSSSSAGVVVADPQQVAAAETQCELDSGNDVLSCWPLSNTTVPQHQWATFVWNSRLPQYAQTNLVDIFLFHGDSQEMVLNITNEPNPTDQAGFITRQVNDTWWGSRGNMFDGTSIPFLFYWVITPASQGIDNALHQATFTALQTTFADSIIASMSSTAAAASASAASASSASAASAASASAAAASRSATLTSTGSSPSQTLSSGAPGASGSATSGAGSVQSGNGGSNFPHWAIAVIVVLGFFALVATGILAFFISRRLRNRRNSMLSHRGSMGSSTPMMAAAAPQGPQSPLLGGAALGAAAGAAAGAHRPASADAHDGASTVSGSEAAPFSGADAAIMADAFRAALRKPDFASRPVEEGESPDDNGVGPSQNPDRLLNQELAEEGRDIRSVSSSRGVRVETLSDAEDDDNETAQDYPH
ncbi:hypothetical protein CERSUDRAFT_112080 [Gelatoporia subvermispora B]|uniref:Uncharacterized protein n=1 Tax=Ceriporiopsis subvermispora (strain B) TaxID=914234 RepID=M2RMW8_CERS8|nr:hypothetical protein CERSUDRAFT_112080 [Gelatoporia subvermispora B]